MEMWKCGLTSAFVMGEYALTLKKRILLLQADIYHLIVQKHQSKPLRQIAQVSRDNISLSDFSVGTRFWHELDPEILAIILSIVLAISEMRLKKDPGSDISACHWFVWS
jgi:hypothetical protein